MATKKVSVTARIRPAIKETAERILKRLGVPHSVLINALYRQVVITGGIPFPITFPKPKSLGEMTQEEFDAMMEEALEDISAGRYLTLEDAFDEITASLENDPLSE